ncbi:expressed protein [Chlorella variabilis]|uniref:Expressed protein n=1 Tax=Chlorella variabilis TaxID=554065 RepID=E1ZNJ5_CHLVA|nr:expressed protein [Chlorella variabilis]EFN52616.1 expressed protein [Chlorella variabilis]|eukprot:XP_005844718.1 expressed protein [Chlorella variabilis]
MSRPALRAVETHSAVCRATASSSSCSDGGSGASDDGAANPPWVLANYYTKKLERRTDSLGNISSSPDTIAEGPGWTREAQLRLAAQALAAELQQDAAVRQLHALLPAMEVQLSRMRPAELVRLAARLEQISQLLVALRLRFPASDVAAMAAAHPPLLSMTPEQLREAVAAVQREFPDASQEDLEAMLATNATLLDAANLRGCMEGVGHLLTRQQLMCALQHDVAFQFQVLQGQSRGERDAEYLSDMYRPI